MSDSKQYHYTLINNLLKTLRESSPFNTDNVTEEDTALIQAVEQLSSTDTYDETLIESGQWVICRLVAQYPHITPLVSRDLFWFFGGDCLHFMPDEEISLFQQLDELRFEQESETEKKSYEELRAQVFGLH